MGGDMAVHRLCHHSRGWFARLMKSVLCIRKTSKNVMILAENR